MKSVLKPIIGLVIVGALVATSGAIYWRWKYPYGYSHCCIIGLMQALESYARSHDGRYPAGQSSPEAALSLLYKTGDLDPYTLRGMTITEHTTRSILESGKLLSPSTCGWHYQEGLTEADDPKLALAWCKEPLGHNGERTSSGARQVVFVGGELQWIDGKHWPGFLEEQTTLLTKRTPRARAGAPLVVGEIEFPDGSRTNRLDDSCTFTDETKTATGSSTGQGNGSVELIWYHAPIETGTITRTISFSNLTSAPVTITFNNGVPDITNYVFKMRTQK